MSRFNPVVLLLLSYVSHISCDKFYYFAYGSNLVGKRLRIHSPSAELYGPAVLDGYRLDFNVYDNVWEGAVATIVQDPEESVTGALWTLDVEDMKNLDKQEDVDTDWYYVLNITVTTMNGEKIAARSYAEVAVPPKKRACDDLPYERRPSNTYLEVLIFGAVECGLPSDYVGYLVSIPTNGKNAAQSMRDKLGYPFGEKKVVKEHVKDVKISNNIKVF